MAWKLTDLILASGNSGVAGQSFRNHVTGAVTGAAMTDYQVTGWSFSAPPTNGATYTGTQNFGGNITFTQGSRAGNIKRTGAAMTDPVPTLSYTAPTGGTFAITTNSIVGAATGSTYNVQITPGYNNTGSSPAGNPGWFDGYTSPTTPAGTGPDNVTMFGSLTGVGAVTGSQGASWSDIYVVDIGPFNSTLSVARSILMNNRLEDVGDWDWEWHANSSYTSLLSSVYTYTFGSSQNGVTTAWVRAARKLSFTHIWENVGAITFTDPRATAPTVNPTAVAMHNPSSHNITADWTNTSSILQIHVSWEMDSTGSGAWAEVVTRDYAIGTTASPSNVGVTTVGKNYRCRARYFNSAGNGPYSSYSPTFPVT
jgi:hypothetical protein